MGDVLEVADVDDGFWAVGAHAVGVLEVGARQVVLSELDVGVAAVDERRVVVGRPREAAVQRFERVPQ